MSTVEESGEHLQVWVGCGLGVKQSFILLGGEKSSGIYSLDRSDLDVGSPTPEVCCLSPSAYATGSARMAPILCISVSSGCVC